MNSANPQRLGLTDGSYFLIYGTRTHPDLNLTSSELETPEELADLDPTERDEYLTQLLYAAFGLGPHPDTFTPTDPAQ